MSSAAFIDVGIFLGFFVLMEASKRWFKLKPEHTRKVVHVGSCLLIATMPFYIQAYEVMILAGAFIGLLLLTRFYGLFSAVQGVKRKTVGEFTLPLGAVLAAYFFLPNQVEAFQAGFVILGFSDTVAEWAGTKWKWIQVTIFGGDKSLGGAIAFFISAYILLSILALYWGVQLSPLKLVAGLVLLTFVELSQSFGIDNMFIPVTTAIVWEWCLVE